MFRFQNVTLSLTGPTVGLERIKREADVLRPLFVDLGNRRALLYSHVGRPVHQSPHVAQSVREIRALLIASRKELKGGKDAAAQVDAMAKACRQFLDAVEQDPSDEVEPNLEPALGELRELFRLVGQHVAAVYRLPEARAFVLEMYEEDRKYLDVQAANARHEMESMMAE